MRKKEKVGRIKSLVHNVNDNFDLFLKSEEVVMEQIKALGLEKELKNVSWSYIINFEIDGVKYLCLKKNGGCVDLEGRVF